MNESKILYLVWGYVCVCVCIMKTVAGEGAIVETKEITGGIGLKEKGCRTLCQQDFTCVGYSQNINNIALTSCIHAYYNGVEGWNKTDVFLPEGYYDLIEKDWSAVREGGVVCSPYTKQCVMCPEYPIKWLEHVGPNYVVYILPTCNIKTVDDLYSDGTVVFSGINASIKIPYNNITIITVGNSILQTPVCPLFEVIGPTSVEWTSIQNLTMECPHKSHSGIRISKVPKLIITLQNIDVSNVLSAVLIIGGNTGTGERVTYSTIDLSQSKFQNINARASSYPSPAAVSMANFEGVEIQLVDFSEDQMVVCQALLNDTNLAPMFSIEGSQAPRVFNISQYTEIFGSTYEIMYYNMGAYEKDGMSTTLGILLLYQLYFLFFMLSLLFVLHQDILYYLYQRRKIDKTI